MDGKGKSAGKAGVVSSATREVEVVLTEDLNTVGMSISEMVGLVGGQEGGVGQVFLSHSTPSPATSVSANQNLLPQLTLTPTSSSVTDTDHIHMSKGDTCANVLLFSCGSCNETFSTQIHLEEHQTLHLDSLGPAGGGVVATESCTEADGGGVSLVGATPLLADFEEVVETTTVADSGQGSELLGLDAVRNESGQAQYDLLQTFTASVNQLTSDNSLPTAQATTDCTYCGKAFKTSSGLTRHLAQVRPMSCSTEYLKKQSSFLIISFFSRPILALYPIRVLSSTARLVTDPSLCSPLCLTTSTPTLLSRGCLLRQKRRQRSSAPLSHCPCPP